MMSGMISELYFMLEKWLIMAFGKLHFQRTFESN